METGLRLLMRDGAIRVAFHPRLDAQHYAEFLEMVERATTRQELRSWAKEAAQRWSMDVECEDVGV
jgi:hypothetical protein